MRGKGRDNQHVNEVNWKCMFYISGHVGVLLRKIVITATAKTFAPKDILKII
jgi:hypothetical protein